MDRLWVYNAEICFCFEEHPNDGCDDEDNEDDEDDENDEDEEERERKRRSRLYGKGIILEFNLPNIERRLVLMFGTLVWSLTNFLWCI